MPKISDMIPSKYLKASDCEDRDLTLTIDMVRQEEVGYEQKPEWVLYFMDSPKGKALVLNKTNIRTIAGLHGDDSDEWEGKQITLFATEVQFQGGMVPAIRVRTKSPKGKKSDAKPSLVVKPVDDEQHDSQEPPF